MKASDSRNILCGTDCSRINEYFHAGKFISAPFFNSVRVFDWLQEMVVSERSLERTQGSTVRLVFVFGPNLYQN